MWYAQISNCHYKEPKDITTMFTAFRPKHCIIIISILIIKIFLTFSTTKVGYCEYRKRKSIYDLCCRKNGFARITRNKTDYKDLNKIAIFFYNNLRFFFPIAWL